MQTLSNSVISISVKDIGAELSKITSVKNGLEFMWSGDPAVWSGIAPTLFPIVGALKNECYIFKTKTYHMYKHGFFRKSKEITLVERSENQLTYKLESTSNTLKVYPFKFEFYISYTLKDNMITVSHKVINSDNKTLYFSLGGHPAFKCPVYDNEQYSDYQLVFEHTENASTHSLNLDTGLFTGKTEPIFNNNNSISLHYDLFNKDALIFKDLKSRKVTLQNKIKGDILTMYFKDFNQLGVWAKPHANYVCIEPWLGHADHEKTDQLLTTKEGIVSLDIGNEFRASYSIEISLNHL